MWQVLHHAGESSEDLLEPQSELYFQGIESQRGIIPRAFQHIFESLSVVENTKFLVRASYLEIYNEG